MKRMVLFAALVAACAPQPEDTGPASLSERAASACRGELAVDRDYGTEAARLTIRKGWNAVSAGDGVGAAARFVESFDVGPEEPLAYWGLAVAAHVAGYGESTVDACLERAEERYAESAAFQSDAGRIFHQRGRMISARERFDRALELDPGFAEALEGLRRLARARGDEAEAARLQQRIDEIESQSGG